MDGTAKERPTELIEARQPLIDALAQAFAVYGWPEVTGRLFGEIYLANEPLTQDALCQRIGVSKATVSTNLRSLESLHLVHRVTGSNNGISSGRPRAYFEAERNFTKVAQELLRHNARREIELMNRGLDGSRSRLETLANHADPRVALQAREDLVTIANFETYRRWANRLLWLVQGGERVQSLVASLRPERETDLMDDEPHNSELT